ncbi:porin family protein [Oryzomonas sagensis]|uniref:Porin family protein n=1 Tax=Oryzomonas sagensis TaxID=2603857 RepID=A0ABQ6TLC9_9BACT|nr:outer membrane beta-barrel protein [Oryzomonas sagensis]KAB0669043.1 porin family protein [Oryzomonas sagensis]
MKRLFSPYVLVVALTGILAAQTAFAFRDGYRNESPYNPYGGVAPYLSIAGGAWLPTHTTSDNTTLTPTETRYDGGVGVAGAFGAELGPFFRLENELSYRYAPGHNGGGDTWALAWMINGWLQARNRTPVTPYFGAGLGLGRGHVASAGPWDGDMTGLAYQAGFGLDIMLDRVTSLDIGYRYFGITESDNNNAGGGDLAGSSIMAGVRFRF